MLLHRWFIGLAIDDEVWDHSSFSKNRERLLEHASVDGTLIQAWASHMSFVRKDGASDNANDDANGGSAGCNAQANWKGKPRSNDTLASTTDPDA